MIIVINKEKTQIVPFINFVKMSLLETICIKQEVKFIIIIIIC